MALKPSFPDFGNFDPCRGWTLSQPKRVLTRVLTKAYAQGIGRSSSGLFSLALFLDHPGLGTTKLKLSKLREPLNQTMRNHKASANGR